MIRGIIYMYTSPSGKSYIGQTIDEKKRRLAWFSSRFDYAGDKINKARAKYGRDVFVYTVLFSHVYRTKQEAIDMLDSLETFYIDKYDTYKNGYNLDRGGRSHIDYKVTKETRNKLSVASKKWQSTPEGKAKLSLAQKKRTDRKKGYRLSTKFESVVQLTMDGKYLAEFPSIIDAANSFKTTKTNSIRANISAVCKGKRDSAAGYKWLYKEEYYKYFLSPKTNMPEGVTRALKDIENRKNPKLKKAPKKRIYKKKEGPRINRFAKQIGQYDANLKLVRVWRNGMEAGKELGICTENIYRASRTLGMYMGYYWRKYDGQQTIQKKEVHIDKSKYEVLKKKVVQKDKKGNIIAIHDSVEDARKSIGVNHTTCLSKCLSGKAHTAYGYIWEELKCS